MADVYKPGEEPDADELATNVVSVVDDDGVEHEFEILDELETEDGYFLALLPSYDDPSEMVNDDGELIFWKWCRRTVRICSPPSWTTKNTTGSPTGLRSACRNTTTSKPSSRKTDYHPA